MALIQLSAITKRFTQDIPVDALRGVDLAIEPGTFVAIEGESGSGKSTLLNIIGLLDSSSSGTYLVADRAVADLNAKALAQLRSLTFGFIFQSFHLLDRRPAVDSVELGMMYSAIPAAERRSRALAALEKVGLSERAFTRANLLSGGERQRIAIARAIASDNPILIADEPTGNLDTANSELIVGLLRSMADDGKTVIMVTHSDTVAQSADVRLRMVDGKLSESVPVRPLPVAAVAEPDQDSRRPSIVRTRDLISDALRGSLSRLSRTLGLALTVAIAVGLVVTTLGLAASSSAQVASTFNAAENRQVSAAWTTANISGNYQPTAKSAVDQSKKLAGVKSAVVVSSHDALEVQANSTRATYNAPSYSSTGDVVAGLGLRVRWATGQPQFDNAVLVGASLANQLELGPVDGQVQIKVLGRSFPVAGVIEASTRMPELSGALLFGDTVELPKPPQEQLFLTCLPGAARQVANQLALAIAPTDASAIDVNAPTDPRNLRAKIESNITLTLLALSAVASLAAIAALTNAMVLAVLERRQELGLRRALGARAVHLVNLIVLESGAIGIVGGILGFVVGLITILAITIANRWIPVFDFTVAPMAVGGGLLVGVLGGVVASVRAARIKPSDALRQ